MIITAILVLVLWDTGHWARYMIGLPFSIAAYAGSIWSYKILGKANTYFASQGLVTTGVYAYSRNPGYVGSFLAGLGLAMIAGSWVVNILAALLWAVYLAFALNEERWLGTIYGRGFDAYMAQTPRFLDMRSLKRAMADMRG
jgi:protein-S-isoprenylcysteine O-methyltransferase Ste14